MNKEKVITVVTACEDHQLISELSAKLAIETVVSRSVTHLIRLVSSSVYYTDLIIIDIDELYNYSKAKTLDLVMALRTLVDCACGLKIITTINIPIAIAVDSTTDLKLIRELLSTNYITGLYPKGKEFTFDEKVGAITDLINNSPHIPVRINKLLNEKKKSKKSATNEITLTARQQQILNLIVERGASNKLISRMLNISESTVKLHVTQILKKHRLTNRTQLALFAKT